MRDRAFTTVSIQRGQDGRRQSGAEIVCGDCGARDVVINATRYQHMPPIGFTSGAGTGCRRISANPCTFRTECSQFGNMEAP